MLLSVAFVAEPFGIDIACNKYRTWVLVPIFLTWGVLLKLHAPGTLRNMICIAEEAIDAIKERDRLAELRSATEDVGTAPETARV